MQSSAVHFFLLFGALHSTIIMVSATRLPMEIVELSSSDKHTVIIDTNTPNGKRHKYQTITTTSTGSPTITTIKGILASTDQRKSRQIIDELQTPRILYQVGVSESDLPICEPNAVCSKIDLYETPWIERQCRCPKSTYTSNKHGHVIYHPKDSIRTIGHQKLDGPTQTSPDNIIVQHQTNFDYSTDLLNDDSDDTHYNENVHLKNLFRKLGDFYKQDDIVFDDDNKDVTNDYNDYHVLHSALHRGHVKKSIYPYYERDYNSLDPYETTVKRVRHSAHRNDIPRIGGCPSSIGADDGHTIADKTRHYKLCEPVHKLPVCRFFRDYVWTLKSSPELNVTEQIVHCRCPKNSVTYLIKREPLKSPTQGYTYLFACSPQSRLRCQRKEPCKLFTVRKRQEFLDEVNTNPLCQCPRSHRCPRHHTDSGVILGKSFIEDNIRTYSGYCMPDTDTEA